MNKDTIANLNLPMARPTVTVNSTSNTGHFQHCAEVYSCCPPPSNDVKKVKSLYLYDRAAECKDSATHDDLQKSCAQLEATYNDSIGYGHTVHCACRSVDYSHPEKTNLEPASNKRVPSDKNLMAATTDTHDELTVLSEKLDGHDKGSGTGTPMPTFATPFEPTVEATMNTPHKSSGDFCRTCEGWRVLSVLRRELDKRVKRSADLLGFSDPDKDGMFTKSQLMAGLKHMHIIITDAELDHLSRDVLDRDDDGRISRAQFDDAFRAIREERRGETSAGPMQPTNGLLGSDDGLLADSNDLIAEGLGGPPNLGKASNPSLGKASNPNLRATSSSPVAIPSPPQPSKGQPIMIPQSNPLNPLQPQLGVPVDQPVIVQSTVQQPAISLPPQPSTGQPIMITQANPLNPLQPQLGIPVNQPVVVQSTPQQPVSSSSPVMFSPPAIIQPTAQQPIVNQPVAPQSASQPTIGKQRWQLLNPLNKQTGWNIMLRMCMKLHNRGITHAELILNKFDTDASGHLTVGEFKRGLDSVLIYFSNSQYADLIQLLDRNGDGLIGREELHEAIQQAAKSLQMRF
jgi:Ca2+-binding EF-hand superfamily protein